MKKLLTVLLITGAISTSVSAQRAPQQGVITYDMAVQLRKQVARKNPAIAAIVPEETHVTIEAHFSGSTFAIVEREVQSVPANANRMMYIQSGGTGNEKHIVDLQARTERTECVLNKRSFYTERSGTSNSITYAAGVKQIAGYSCSKAIVTTSDKKRYEVWYTTAIPYAYNPEGLQLAGIKGAVLGFTSDEMSCQAVSVRSNGFLAGNITINTTARKVTKEQMQDLQADAVSENIKRLTPAKNGQREQVQTMEIRL